MGDSIMFIKQSNCGAIHRMPISSINTMKKQGEHMSSLFTAFKGIHNTSFKMVKAIGRDSLFLTNSYQGLEKDIRTVSNQYASVYMFGVDKMLTDTVKIETCAIYNGERVSTDFDVELLKIRLQNNNITYIVSRKPTTYLCNAAYYHMLKKTSNTIFIHIPSLKGMTDELMIKLVDAFTHS